MYPRNSIGVPLHSSESDEHQGHVSGQEGKTRYAVGADRMRKGVHVRRLLEEMMKIVSHGPQSVRRASAVRSTEIFLMKIHFYPPESFHLSHTLFNLAQSNQQSLVLWPNEMSWSLDNSPP